MISPTPIAFSIWLALLGYQISVFTLSRARRSHQHVTKDNNMIISKLPDDVLISILARIPIKDAVRTSILSKRWKNLFKLVPDVDLRCDYLVGHNYTRNIIFDILYRYCGGYLIVGRHNSTRCPHNLMFFDIVHGYLYSRRGSNIRRLVFCCCLTKSYADRFEAIIRYLGTTASIRKLAVHCCCSLRSCTRSFSGRLLCETPSLSSLELNVSILQPNLKISESNKYSLQIIRLSNVTLREGALDCILSNCLILHSLRIDYCEFSCSKLCFRGPNLRLKHLNIEECRGGVEEIEFYASNLITFEFQNRKVVKFIFDHVPHLQSIYLGFFYRNIIHYVRARLPMLLPPHQPKSLTLASASDVYQISRRTRTNTFSNLRQLRLRLWYTAYVNLLLVMIPFLQSCPCLEEFHLDTESVECNGRKLKRPPVAVIHSELKKVEITGFCGSRNEIEFALHILKSAPRLEQMQISRCPKWHIGFVRWMEREDKTPWSQQTRKKILKQLQSQALSKTARVIIQHVPKYDDTWSRYETD
ncbi:F-box/LRR-repeat protein 13 [Phtheirospermum japonicum]|uniref:F-box/LRR-repeat protein 13 n=1 Tax=Phtheirospermum japonicum TaxID=374723 RepID=A0A830B1C7_9LAMI|nr:F-box/LRR-repeat protein 13 [Phtheirospermum japonicum]